MIHVHAYWMLHHSNTNAATNATAMQLDDATSALPLPPHKLIVLYFCFAF